MIMYLQSQSENPKISLFLILTQRRAYVAEFKIVIYFSFLLLCLLVVISQAAIRIAWREPYRNLTENYFLCEAVGHIPGRCSREPLEQYTFVISLMNCIYYIMTAFSPVIHLMFVINCRILKEGVLRMKTAQTLRSISKKSSQ